METKIKLKNLYLITLIAIGLLGLGIGSTFAMFTASATINNPIAFNSNLSSINILAETIEVVVPAGEDKYVDLVISNTNAESLNYNVWYSPSSNDLEVGSESSNNSYGPVGVLPSAGNFTLTVGLRNNSNSPIAVTIGVSSSESSIILPGGTTTVPFNKLLPYAADYITNLYTEAEKSTATVNSITYSLASSVGLMRDQFGSSSSAENTGNLRYYGADPSNYVWLGDSYTSDYTIPGTISDWGYSDFQDCIYSEGYDEEEGAIYCTEDIVRHTGDKKLWRIIGVFDGRIKLVTADPISTTNLSWDTSESGVNGGTGINQWGPSGTYEGADLMRLLNPGFESESVNNSLYWNKTSSGTVYTGNSNATTGNVSFANTGLTANERSLIDTATWYTGAYDEISYDENSYVDAHYTAERGTMGKICSGGNWCNDEVTRTNTWNGKVGLISASDYGYAANLAQCNQTLNNNYYETGCVDTNWLKSNGGWMWTVSPRAGSASHVFRVYGSGDLSDGRADDGGAVRPAVFLKSGVTIDVDGKDGSFEHPYVLNY